MSAAGPASKWAGQISAVDDGPMDGKPINYTQSFVRLETDGKGFRLHCDYAVCGLDEARREILLRRALAVLAQEEHRIYGLTDATALAELDACKLQDGTVHVAQR